MLKQLKGYLALKKHFLDLYSLLFPCPHFQQSHFMPMFPMVSYPYPYQLQQNVHQVHQNVHNGHQHVHNGHQHVHNEHQYEHPVQHNVHSVHQKAVQGANHEIAPTVHPTVLTVPNVPGVHPSVPYVLVPVIHVPYVYYPPVYNYNLPNVHLNESQ